MEITKQQYITAAGLLQIGQSHSKWVNQCHKQLEAILEPEADGLGHTGDAMYCEYSIDELLGKLDLTVEAE